MSGITENLIGIVDIDERHEMTQYDDILNITDATVTLVVPGDLFTNEGNDTVTIADSTLNGAAGTSLFLGSGDDNMTISNSTLSLAMLAGSGNDTVTVTGTAQSEVVLNAAAGVDNALSLGSGNDVLELRAIFSGTGNINFDDGSDTLYFNGGKLITTGTMTGLENLSVSSLGGNLGRNITLSGTENILMFNGNLTGTDAGRIIYVTGKAATLNTTNNVKTNVAFSISGSVFTHADGGTLEISYVDGTAIIASGSTVSLHNTVLANNAAGINASSSFLTLKDSNISNHSGNGISAAGGSLSLQSVGFSNNECAVNLTNTTLTGNDLSFSQNSFKDKGGAIYLNGGSAILSAASFGSNIATAYSTATASVYAAHYIGTPHSASASTSTYSTAQGGAIYACADTLEISDADFTNNQANANANVFVSAIALCSGTATASATAYSTAQGGAIYASADILEISDADFTNNQANANVNVNANLESFGSASGGYTYAILTATAYSTAQGGGIYASAGTLEISDADFTNNQAYANVSATVSASGSNKNRNNILAYLSAYSTAQGGAIYASAGPMKISNADFTNNQATATVTATVTASASATPTAYSNVTAYSTAQGGAIYASAGTWEISDADFTNNQANANVSCSSYHYYYATATAYSTAQGGALYAKDSIINMTDVTFVNNYATATATANARQFDSTISQAGGAIFLAGESTLTYTVTSGKSIKNTGNHAHDGGFLYMDNTAAKFIFDIKENANVTIGDANNKDSIAGTGSVSKNGDGYLLINSDVSEYTGSWVISGGTLELAGIARNITLDNWTIGVGTMLKLSSLDDTITMGMDKNIGVIDLGGGNDIINTGGYTLSGGELRISKLKFTGGGIVKSTITTRSANAGFDLTLANVRLESTINGGNATDVITISQDSTILGAMTLGNGNNTITATANAIFANTLTAGADDDTLMLTSATFEDVNLGEGNNKITATGNAEFQKDLLTGNGDDTLDFAAVTFSGKVNLGGGKNTVTARGSAVMDDGYQGGSGIDVLSFAEVTASKEIALGDGDNSVTATGEAKFASLTAGNGNDKITLNGESSINGVIDLGKGTNTIYENSSLSVNGGVQMTDGGSTTIIVNRDTTFTDNTISAYFDSNAELTRVDYDWSSVADLDKVKIVVSNDSTFATYEFAIELYNQSKTFTIYTEKSNFIQFQAQDEDGWKQRILPDTVAPEQVKGLTLRSENGVATGEWNIAYDNIGGNGVKQYNIQVSTDANFSNIVGEYTTTVNSYDFAGLAENTYYVRIQAEDYTANKGEWSSVSSFVYDNTEPSVPRSLSSSTGEYTVNLGWSAATDTGSGVKNYEYRIATDRDFSDIVVSATTSENQNILVNEIAYGNYYWSVRAIDNAGNISSWSNYKTFTIIDLVAPTVPGELDYFTEDDYITLDWLSSVDDDLGSGFKGYEYEIATDAEFKNIVRTESALTGTRYTVDNLAEAVYFARVRSEDNAGNKSGWSNVQKITVGDPDFNPPSNPTQLDVSVEGQTVTFRWAASSDDKSGVKEYVVSYSNNGAQSTFTTTATTFVLENATVGSYQWSVQAVDNAGNKSGTISGDDFSVAAAVEKPASSDINGNGISDVMFQYTGGDMQIGFWMDGTNNWQGQGAPQPAEWELLGAYDMNSNGKADAVMVGNVTVNGVKGAYIGYYTDGNTDQWENISFLNNPDDVVWKNAVGNLTGNEGKNSIVWHAPEMAALGVWIDGTDNWVSINGGFDSSWSMLGTGDFNGDGKDEVLFENNDNFYTIDIDGNFASLGGFGAGWDVRAIGDFSGDGKDDLVIFHNATGSVVKFENGQSSQWSSLGQLDANDWFVVGAGDYQNDGKDDLLVRQYSTGMLGYYADGDMSKWNELGRGVDMNWTVIA